MNNKLHLFRGGLTAFWLTIVLSLPAQPISSINESNEVRFIAEMNDYFEGIMYVTDPQLSAFIQHFTTSGITNNNCTTPLPEVMSEDGHQVTFGWPGTHGAHYEVGYLNLRTGAKGFGSTNDFNYLFEVPDGLYLFVFQQDCGIGKSDAIIIILDKVVAIQEDLDLECACPVKTIIDDEEEVAAFDLSELQEFDIVLESVEEQTLIYRMHAERLCSGCEDFSFNSACIEAAEIVYTYSGATYFQYMSNAEPTSSVIAFETDSEGDGLYLLENIDASIYTLKIISCFLEGGGSRKGRKATGNTVAIGANQYRVQDVPIADQTSTLLLFNQAGQILKRWAIPDSNDAITQDIDLTPYPAGMYFLKLEGLQAPWVRKLIRS